MSVDLDRFLEDAKSLKDEAEQGRKIQEAARNGFAKTPDYERDPAPGYDGHLRDLIASFVLGKWNEERRSVSLDEIYQGVREKIAREQEDKTWPKIWLFPSKRTVDRRTNETARLEFYMDDVPPTVCVKAGHYQANPALFEEAVKDEIKLAGLAPSKAQTGTGQPHPPFPPRKGESQ